jgi:hypothetical protein
MASSTSQGDFDHVFKLLMIGDSGVGKSSLLLRFTSDSFDDLSPTIGMIPFTPNSLACVFLPFLSDKFSLCVFISVRILIFPIYMLKDARVVVLVFRSVLCL